LGERTRRHLQFYKEGNDAEFFEPDSNKELVHKVQQLLNRASYRENLRLAGRAALLRQKHTYKDRLIRLFEIYACGAQGSSNDSVDLNRLMLTGCARPG
jgi:hypothetical protein